MKSLMVFALPKSFLPALFLTACCAWAQEGATKPPPAAPPAVVKPEPKPEWFGSIGGGVQAEAGRTAQRGVMLSGQLAKKFTGADTVSFDGQATFASYSFQGQPRVTAANNHLVGAQYIHRLNNRFFLADRAFSSADTVLGIRNRQFNAVGVGINFFESKKGQFYIVPGYGFGNQNTSDAVINGFHTGFASYEKFTYQLNKQMAVQQWSQVRMNAQYRSDRSIQGYLGVDFPALYKRLYLSMGVTYTYEGDLTPQAIAGGGSRNDALFAVKFNYRIGK